MNAKETLKKIADALNIQTDKPEAEVIETPQEVVETTEEVTVIKAFAFKVTVHHILPKATNHLSSRNSRSGYNPLAVKRQMKRL